MQTGGANRAMPDFCPVFQDLSLLLNDYNLTQITTMKRFLFLPFLYFLSTSVFTIVSDKIPGC